ncbi:histidine phosphatase family protein [Zhongshania sp.]|uniref:histidine phosphatase family protein n=1 Tax=Zhongshania sp. TaxID=1971902 RepID=UPI00356277CB
MAELFLVRHGQASINSDNYDQLSSLGHQQSRWLGEYFAERGLVFDHIITGQMVRHRETAEGVLAGFGEPSLRLETTPDWDEFDFDRLISQFLIEYPTFRLADDVPRSARYGLLKQALEHWAAGKLHGDLPESWDEFEGRLARQLAALQSQSSSAKILVISSGGAIAMALRLILMSPASMMVKLNLQTRNASLSHCYFNSGGFSLSSFNAVPHLDTPERRELISYF